jgi:pimeloyl-ACP methyl ester carboxylesterase
VYLWDMPGYGESSKHPEHRVSLDVQGELFADLLTEWDLESPHIVAHDYGGVVALRAHLLHGRSYACLALVDVVALAPWG